MASALGGAAAAHAAWQTPISISSRGSIGPVSVAVNARGDTIAAWTRGVQPDPSCEVRGSFTIEAAFRPARGSWRRAVRLGTGQLWCGRGSSVTPSVSVAVDPRGRAIVGWREANFSSDRELIRTASRSASGGWRRPVVLYRGGKFPLGEEAWPSGPPPQLVLDHSGNATAAWNGQAAFKPAGRAWGEPATIGSGSDGDVKLALDAKGDATALWTQTISMGRGVVVRSAFKPAKGSWQQAVTLGQGLSGYGGAPDLAVDTRGNSTAVWTDWVRVKPSACTGLVHAGFRPAGGGWRHPVTLQRYRGTVRFNGTSYCTGPFIDVRVAFGRRGSVAAVWSASTSDFTGAKSVVRAASKPAGRSWGRAVTIAAGSHFIDSLRVAGSPRGNALAVWHLSGFGAPDAVQAAMAWPLDAWRSPITLGTGTQPDAALDAHGNAVAVWVHDLRTTNLLPVQLVVQAAAFTR